MNLPNIIPAEEVARAQWAIVRSDDAGVVQLPRGRFTQIETGISYSSDIYDQDPQRIKQAPLRLYSVDANNYPDPRWFENHAATLAINEVTPAVDVTWTATIKPFSSELKIETKSRVWDDADGRLSPYDMFWGREQEFGTEPDLEIRAYRASVKDAAQDAEESIDLATDSTAIARGESAYDTAVNALTAPDRNKFRR